MAHGHGCTVQSTVMAQCNLGRAPAELDSAHPRGERLSQRLQTSKRCPVLTAVRAHCTGCAAWWAGQVAQQSMTRTVRTMTAAKAYQMPYKPPEVHKPTYLQAGTPAQAVWLETGSGLGYTASSSRQPWALVRKSLLLAFRKSLGIDRSLKLEQGQGIPADMLWCQYRCSFATRPAITGCPTLQRTMR